VHNTHIDEQVRALHAAMLEIVSAMNQPERDEALMREAGISLDGALFPLLVGIDRFGPIGVVDLADRAGRDHTTVSRQVARLEALGLVERRANSADRRVREAAVTARGKAMTERLDEARARMGRAVFASWAAQDVDELVRLLGRFARAVKDGPAGGGAG